MWGQTFILKIKIKNLIREPEPIQMWRRPNLGINSNLKKIKFYSIRFQQ